MIAQPTINRKNNFDFLRLILASLVIVSHSYPLTKEKEILALITQGQLDFGSFAVDGFFVFSGYFIFISLQRSKTIKNYLWKRLLRLLPALFTLMAFTLLLLPFIYHGPHLTYTIKNFHHYTLGALSLYNVQYFIPGVFESNPYKGVINGSLWSLSYEFTMYVALVALFLIRKKKISFFIIAVIFSSAYFLHLFQPNFLNTRFEKFNLESNQLYRLTVYFFAGSLLSFFNLSKINTFTVRLVLTLILFVAVYAGFYIFVAPLILPILLLFLGILKTPKISSLSEKIGDISYGIYIYGFIVQQTLMSFLHLNAVLLMCFSLPLTFILAYLSWHLVEEKTLKYKNAF